MSIALRLQEKGRKEGFEIGLKEVHEEFRKQQLTTAQYLLKSGVDLELIINCTGLSREEINSV
ncbi:hypothetical protein [Providencia rettgeri]|uniref:hypothetical protein n=1 Tax=Providencia rettgeri TaxID=587 RepID=UPI0023AA5617|nr:hypothetical protein [Providencia rettgeri]